MRLPFAPMLLERVPAPFADPQWLYQVKWDGVRNITLVEGGHVRHWSRRLRDRTPLFPELDGLAGAIGGVRAVFDGELIVMKGGKPSFSAILERDVAGGLDRRKVQTLPATLMLFDLLEYGDQELYRLPLTERLARLESIVTPADSWQVVASFPGTAGPDLFKAVGEAAMEGVVAKRLTSTYQVGVRSRDWIKIKHRRRMLAVVCGYTVPVGRAGGLILGAYADGQLTYVGRAGSGLNVSQWHLIREQLPRSACPFAREPSLKDRFSGPPGPVVWTRPLVTVWIEFSEWTEEQKLRDPVVAGFATEPPEAAIRP